MIVPVMAIWNLVLTQQIYSEETNGAHAHYRELVPLTYNLIQVDSNKTLVRIMKSSTFGLGLTFINSRQLSRQSARLQSESKFLA